MTEGEQSLEKAQIETLGVHPENAPYPLREDKCWVVWKWQIIDGELKKPPYNPETGRMASVNDPASWVHLDQARAAYLDHRDRWDGIGFILLESMGIVGIDLDHCVQGNIIDPTRQIHPKVLSFINLFGATYVEYSPSGSGIHILVRGSLPGEHRKVKRVEMYQDKRYLTFTGQMLEGAGHEILENQIGLNTAYDMVFARLLQRERQAGGDRARSVVISPRYLEKSDTEIIAKARSAKNGALFSSLYDGDTSSYSSPSNADLAFCRLLVYWTNGNREQMERIFRSSGLFRDKWDSPRPGGTYGSQTLDKALGQNTRS